jgi:hypothetical protein
MELKATYYDFVKNVRPYVIELTSLDVADLKTQLPTVEAIHSTDDYPSRIEECFDLATRQEFSKAPGLANLGFKELQPLLASTPPHFKAHLASLYSTVNSEYHTLLNFCISGKKTFFFSESLSDHLAQTEINLKANLIELPFTSCLFNFTAQSVVTAMHRIRSNGDELSLNSEDLDYDAPVSVFLTKHPAGTQLPGYKLIITALPW